MSRTVAEQTARAVIGIARRVSITATKSTRTLPRVMRWRGVHHDFLAFVVLEAVRE